MKDKYLNFAALALGERLGKDYRIRLIDRASPIVVLAPHGGCIEPGTSKIAEAIAGDDFSIYCFEGRVRGRDLHITSSHFNEPQALDLIAASSTVVTVHGRADRGDKRTVCMGGRDIAMRDAIASSLAASGFSTATSDHQFPGQEITNICNRGATYAGVQLEIPRTQRDRLAGDQVRLRSFADAVRRALTAQSTARPSSRFGPS